MIAAPVTGLLALALVCFASSLAGRPDTSMRALAYNFSPAFAAAFFLVAPFSGTDASLPDVLAGLLFEFVMLCFFCKLFISMLSQVKQLNGAATRRALCITLALQIVLALPIITTDGFGIFSEGSRIEFLYARSSAKYFTYAGFLLMNLQAGLFAHRISATGRPRGTDYLVLAANFFLMLVSGSKGAFFLWLLGSLALVDYKMAQIRYRVIAGALLVTVVAFAGMVQVISSFLGITIEDFLTLAVNRFFLGNDARALAFDLRIIVQPGDELLPDSFRSLSTLFGHSPSNPPLGLHLYDHYFGVSNGSGANASLMALIIFYSASDYASLPTLLALLAAFMIYLSIGAVRRLLRGSVARFAVTSWGAFALYQLSQDFLAFQVVVPLIALAIGIMLFLDRGHIFANRSTSGLRAASLDQHNHSGARTRH